MPYRKTPFRRYPGDDLHGDSDTDTDTDSDSDSDSNSDTDSDSSSNSTSDSENSHEPNKGHNKQGQTGGSTSILKGASKTTSTLGPASGEPTETPSVTGSTSPGLNKVGSSSTSNPGSHSSDGDNGGQSIPSQRHISDSAIAGLVFGIFVALVLVAFLLVTCFRRYRKKAREAETARFVENPKAWPGRFRSLRAVGNGPNETNADESPVAAWTTDTSFRGNDLKQYNSTNGGNEENQVALSADTVPLFLFAPIGLSTTGEPAYSRASSPAGTLPNPHDGYANIGHSSEMALPHIDMSGLGYFDQSQGAFTQNGGDFVEARRRNGLDIQSQERSPKGMDFLSVPTAGPPPAYANERDN